MHLDPSLAIAVGASLALVLVGLVPGALRQPLQQAPSSVG